jgi:hypothetical protein
MKPLLVGLLLDVSSSMAKPMHKGDAATRLHRLQEAVDDLVARARAIVDESPERIDGLFHVFAFGFGFGNLRTLAFGRNVPAVRNLLTLGEDNDDVIEGAVLLRDWERYRENIGRLTLDMLGTTPMVEAFGRVERLLDNLESRRFYRDRIRQTRDRNSFEALLSAYEIAVLRSCPASSDRRTPALPKHSTRSRRQNGRQGLA